MKRNDFLSGVKNWFCAVLLNCIVIVLLLNSDVFAQSSEILGFQIISETYNSVEFAVEYYYAGNKGDVVFLSAIFDHQPREGIGNVSFTIGDPLIVGKRAISSYKYECNLNGLLDSIKSEQVKLSFDRWVADTEKFDTVLTKTVPYSKTWYLTAEIAEKESAKTEQQAKEQLGVEQAKIKQELQTVQTAQELYVIGYKNEKDNQLL